MGPQEVPDRDVAASDAYDDQEPAASLGPPEDREADRDADPSLSPLRDPARELQMEYEEQDEEGKLRPED